MEVILEVAAERTLMPKVVISGSSCQRFTGGRTELEVTATNFRRLVLELEQRFPGLGKQVEEGIAIAIDGEIYLIPKIAGG